MDPFDRELNEMLVNTYRSIRVIEEAMLRDMSNGALSVGEMHLIECIGRDKEKGRSVTDIAGEMGVTLPSVTVGIKKLEKKGYVEKQKNASDGRRVCVRLTRTGLRADIAHRYFHRKMVRSIVGIVPDQERPVLLKGLQALNAFFRDQARALEQADRKEDRR